MRNLRRKRTLPLQGQNSIAVLSVLGLELFSEHFDKAVAPGERGGTASAQFDIVDLEGFALAVKEDVEDAGFCLVLPDFRAAIVADETTPALAPFVRSAVTKQQAMRSAGSFATVCKAQRSKVLAVLQAEMISSMPTFSPRGVAAQCVSRKDVADMVTQLLAGDEIEFGEDELSAAMVEMGAFQPRSTNVSSKWSHLPGCESHHRSACASLAWSFVLRLLGRPLPPLLEKHLLV